MRYFYLHGFASGPASSKAHFFRERFAEQGLTLEVPDLTGGDFEHSTLTQQLRFLESLAGGAPAVLLGSSMGGYLAALYAARHADQVRQVMLMAPAFGLAHRWAEMLDEAIMSDWRERGWRSVFHYGANTEQRVSYDLITDGLRYEEFPSVSCPALVFHGRNDDSVSFRLSERFATGCANVELVLCDSDHQLFNVLDPMWQRIRLRIDRTSPPD